MLRETQAARLTQQLVEAGVQAGIWSRHSEAGVELRYDLVWQPKKQEARYYQLAVYCAKQEDRRQVVAAVECWAQEMAGVELRGEGAFRRFCDTHEGKTEQDRCAL